MTYNDFLEKYLGEIKYGWTKDSNNKKTPYQIVKYVNGILENTVCYTTLGLSRKHLQSPLNEEHFRYELIFLADENFGDKNIPAILQQVADYSWKGNIAYLKGDVIGPNNNMFDGTNMEALYVTSPVYFPDEFHIFQDDDIIPIVQVWVFPITKSKFFLAIINKKLDKRSLYEKKAF